MATSIDSFLNPKVLLESAFRHKLKIVLVPIMVAMLTIAILLLAPRTYRSEAKLYLQVGKASIGLDPSATTGQTIEYSQQGRDGEIKSAIEIIKSLGLLGKVVDKVGIDVALGAEPITPKEREPRAPSIVDKLKGRFVGLLSSIDPISDRERVILDARESLSVKAERESTVLVLTFDSNAPQLAKHMLSAIIDTYQLEHSRIHRNQDSFDFFDEQRKSLKQQFDNSISQLRDSKNAMGLASIQGRRDTLEGQLKQVQVDCLETEQNISTAQARIAEIKSQLVATPERMVTSQKSVPNSGADLMREKLYELQVKQKEVLARFTPDHPSVVAIGKQINDAKRIVEEEKIQRDETVMDISAVHQQLSLELTQQQGLLAGLLSRLEKATEQSKTVLSEIRDLNDNEIKLEFLDRDVELNRDRFVKYSKNVEEARIDRQLSVDEISDISVVQEATLSEKPVSPSKTLILAAGLLCAIGGTAMLILASEKADSRVRSSSELQEVLGLPVLGVLPEDPAYARVQWGR